MSKLINTATTLFKIKRVSTTIIAITAVISAVVGFVTFYASQVGNFVISTTNKEYYLFLSETVGFEDPLTVLTAKGVDNFDNTTYNWLDFDFISAVDGSSNSPRHLGYSFYVCNMSTSMVHYNAKLTIERMYKNVDKALWVKVIETRYDTEGKPIVSDTVYAAPVTGSVDRQQETALADPIRGGIIPVNFTSNSTVFDYDVRNVRSMEIVRYTIVLWLEGEDPDCSDEIKLGSMRLSLNFSAFG